MLRTMLKLNNSHVHDVVDAILDNKPILIAITPFKVDHETYFSDSIYDGYDDDGQFIILMFNEK